MGFFGAYMYADGRWSETDPDAGPSAPPAEPWLTVSVHDSDWAAVRYAPAGPGTGEAFLGMTPRVYFEDDEASAPTDPSREASGLAAWASATGAAAVDAATMERFLAGDDDEEPDPDADVPDEDVFVELKCRRFLAALGLPVPADLA